MEIRHVLISNSGAEAREIEVTSCCEIVLEHSATDAAHLTYSKMFVQTEFVGGADVLLATRQVFGEEDIPSRGWAH